MTSQIDHFMYAAPTLDEGLTWAQDVFGVAAAYGGEHVGMGTCNALLALGETYLEIIAPDPAQELKGNLGERFAALQTGGLVTFAVSGELAAIKEQLDHADITSRGPNQTKRNTSEGATLVWELLIPTRTPYGPRLPFFIDWLECPHPSTTNPNAGALTALHVQDPQAEQLARLYQAIGLDQAVVNGSPKLSVEISTQNGPVVLASTDETTRISLG